MDGHCESDAVHHRLSSEANIVTNVPYECYDCFTAFHSLEDLARHSVDNPLHCDEACLKCRGSITVFYQMNKSVRLHKCSKSSLRHLHPELYIQSQFLASKLGLADTSDSTGAVISCDFQGCPAEFDASSEGIFQFLKHVNKLKHSSLSNCKKCSLPDFQLTFRETKIISHYCPKNGKLVYVIKSTLN